MKTALWRICLFGSCIAFPVKVWSKVCSGGYHCTAPHECCAQGCCLYVPSSGYGPKNPIDNYYVISSPIKYYLWLMLLMVVVALSLAWCCRLRRVWRWGCGGHGGCGSCGGAPPASEADSAGSCYYPPQYSRCGSLCRVAAQPAPPPYNEVTSKPDLYPMVIYLGADKGDGDLMVQYFKNYIVRPTGTLSAASTADSLSSSYLCNTANEANTIIPPPYSCAGSLDWSSAPATTAQRQALLRSISSVTCHEFNQAASPRRALHQSSTQLRTETAGIPSSITADNVNSYQSSPVAQTSGNSTQKTTQSVQAHSSSIVPSNVSSRATSSIREYPNDIDENIEHTNPSNHQYFNVWEYSTNEESLNQNLNGTFSVKNNHLVENKSPRQQQNKYYSRTSSESLEEKDYNIYPNYLSHSLPQDSNEIQYTSPGSCVPYQASTFCKNRNREECNDNTKQSNASEQKQDFSFHDSACERNTSISNLNSLEETQFCSFFSHSIAEGVQNENISSDYSIFAKNINNFGSKEEIRRMFSVGNSMTGSEVSSLANLGTPDSPPRATSPTSEFKELLDKIQQLPNQNDDNLENEGNEESFFTSDVNKAKRYFCKNRKNSLYMPLNLVPSSKTFHPGKISPTSNICFKRQFSRKGWLSRSAPTTPCGSGFVPSILTISQRGGTSNSGRISRLSKTSEPDSSPLLTEKDDSGDEMEH